MANKRKYTKKMAPTKIVKDEPEIVEQVTYEEKTHHPFEQWMVDNLQFLMEVRTTLNEWEKSFVLDRARAFDKYGFNAVITDKQMTILHKIYKKAKFGSTLRQMESEK